MTDDPTLDRALAAWARHDPADDAAVARILAAADRETRPVRPHRWWALGGGGLVAASIALALLVNGSGPAGVQPAPLDPGASFALLYTPTPDEDYLL